MQRLPPAEYLGLGRQLARLLGSCLEGASGDMLRELARAYDPSANEARISAEVFLLHKYLIMQSCVGVFPESEVDYIVGGLFAALNERASGLEFSPKRQKAMEHMWQLRAAQFDQPFSQDRVQFLNEGSGPIHWKQTIVRFCQNVREIENPPNIWVGADGPSQAASRSVTAALDQMVLALGEMNRLHFSGSA
ncbi:MAG TPA: hypothetical protein VGQ08_07335 [Nitrospiraceae bacterium]|jgi:hypothetical protein|nr:hypothetical protein [Nitrospiraceae bacterium]